MFHQQGGEPRTVPIKAVEKQEARQACSLLSQLVDPVQNEADDLADCVVPADVIIGGIFLAFDELCLGWKSCCRCQYKLH